MIHKVRKKHQNSKLCFVCGLKNNFGIKAGFYEMDNNELIATFIPCELHQSYPGRLHGGITSGVYYYSLILNGKTLQAKKMPLLC